MLTVPRRMRERIDRVRYSALRAGVAWLVPEAVRFDEGDPLLGAGFAPGPRR